MSSTETTRRPGPRGGAAGRQRHLHAVTDMPNPKGQPPAASEQVARTVRLRAARRTVAQMPLAGHTAPWPVTMLLWAGAGAAHHGGHPMAMTVAVVAPAAAVVWWWQYDRRCNRQMRRKHRRHAAVVTAAALLWLAWASQTGAGGWHAVALWAGMTALMWPYWRRRTIAIPADPNAPVLTEPQPVLEQVAELVVDELPEVVLWATRVSTPGGAGPGSYLCDMQEVPGGRAYTIQLNPGRQTTGQIRAAQAMIGSALTLPMDSLMIDPHPSGALSQARLVIVEGRPLATTFAHPGPEVVFDPVTGYAAIGMHPDEVFARWALFVPGWGLAGGIIVGGVGSGKSTLMKNIATTAAHTGFLSVWAGCPVGGQSFPALLENATWPAFDVAGIMRQLRAMVQLIMVRGALNNVLRRELHVPTADEPGVLLFLDEFHKITSKADSPVFYKEAIALLEVIAREGRKAAVALVAADQTVNVQKTFGNSDVLRSNLWMKNLSVLRVASDVENGMIPGLDGVNPADLPEIFPDGSPTSGLGYLRGLRTAPYRGWFTPNADELLAAAPKVELDTVSARAIGDDYLHRAELRNEAQVEQVNALLSLDPSLLDAIAASNPLLAAKVRESQANPRPARNAAPARGTEPSRVTSSGTVLSLAGDIGPAPSLRLPEPQEPVDEQPSTDDVTDSVPLQRVLDLIASGITITGDLQAAYGCGETRMRDLTNALRAAGKIRRVKKGLWELTTAPAPAPSAPATPVDDDVELLAHAAELVVSSQLASTAMLQRKLRVGFVQAGDLVADLQYLGVIGRARADGTRAVLVTPATLEPILTRIRGLRAA